MGWNGDCSGTDAIFMLTVNGVSDCTANFGLPSISSLAGNGANGFSGDSGDADSASLSFPAGLTADANGNLYFADSGNHRIRRIDSNNIITTVAGDGISGFGGDAGPASAAQLNSPFDIAFDAQGNLYIADFRNHRIRRVDSNGIISTIAGTGEEGFDGDGGLATESRLSFPTSIAIHETGLIFIADSGNHQVRVILLDGSIFTLAGNGTPGFSGDGGPSQNSQLNRPWGLAVTTDALYIADSFNHRIRKVGIDLTIQTVAGNGIRGFSGDEGPALMAQLNEPVDIAIDDVGNLYIVDTQNHRIRIVDGNSIIGTLGGSGASGFSGDGSIATNAQLASPLGITVTEDNQVILTDTANQRIRVIKP